MLPSSVSDPIKDLGKATLSAAANKFADYIITRFTGKSVKVFNAEGDVEADKVMTRWEIEKPLWMQVEEQKVHREYKNLAAVIEKAAPDIVSNEVKIKEDNDFFYGLFEYAKSVTSEEVQNLVAKILAGEYNSPETYSMSTLQVLRSMGKNELANFSNFASLHVERHGFLKDFFNFNEKTLAARKGIDVEYGDFLELQNLGLIRAGDHATLVNMEQGNIIQLSTPSGILLLKTSSERVNWHFPTCYGLTRAGKEIMQHIDIHKSEIFFGWLKTYFIEMGFEELTLQK